MFTRIRQTKRLRIHITQSVSRDCFGCTFVVRNHKCIEISFFSAIYSNTKLYVAAGWHTHVTTSVRCINESATKKLALILTSTIPSTMSLTLCMLRPINLRSKGLMYADVITKTRKPS